ncbi:hypothetical protein LWI28_012220 [Acer negundo]|uniref:MADS-box domain-containing protein n=1 Tax=Acer negundo TaxID=4023 RepID=A0AAD5IA68_ACENE|nr:hypothetical protein LWI28_012220 [Acer negundo]
MDHDTDASWYKGVGGMQYKSFLDLGYNVSRYWGIMLISLLVLVLIWLVVEVSIPVLSYVGLMFPVAFFYSVSLAAMARRKVKLCYIPNDSTRKVTFKKRKKGLLKKVSELSTLCGIDACAIVYSPYENQPDVWPSHHGVQRIVSQFKRVPEMEQGKRMLDQDSFLRQRIMKSNDQLIKQMKDNKEQEMIALMFETLVGRSLHPLGMMDLNDLGWTIEQYLKDIYKYQSDTNNRMAMVAGSSSSSTAAAAAPAPNHGVMRTVGESSQAAASSSGGIDQMEKQPWFMNSMSPESSFNGDDLILPFRDTCHTPRQSNNFLP